MAKRWSEEEMLFLESNWGTKSIPTIANQLNRTIHAVKVKSVKMKLGRHIHSGEYVTFQQLLRAIGLDQNTGYITMRLKRDGFPIKYKKSVNKKYKIVYLNDFWKWTEKNKHKVNFARFEKYALGPEPEWVDVKRAVDLKNPSKNQHKRSWTKEEEDKLIFMCKSNRYTYKDIAMEINRTEAAVKRRLYDMKVPYRPVPLSNHIKWTKEENDKMIELYEKGYDSNAIAKTLNKTQLSISDRLKARGY